MLAIHAGMKIPGFRALVESGILPNIKALTRVSKAGNVDLVAQILERKEPIIDLLQEERAKNKAEYTLQQEQEQKEKGL